MAATDDEISNSYSSSANVKNMWKKVKAVAFPVLKKAAVGAIKATVKKHIGEATFDDISNVVTKETARDVLQLAVDAIDMSDAKETLDQFKSNKRLIAKFRASLAGLSEVLNVQDQSKKYVFILVDELDRCKPHYAIKLLEDIKHLFAVDGIVFIIATDTDQLANSVKAIYGSEFDAKRYLLRFFDRTYRFAEPSRQDFVEFLCSQYAMDSDKLAFPPAVRLTPTISRVFTAFALSLRDIEQCMDMLANCITLWGGPAKLNLIYLLSLIISHHKGEKQLFLLLESCSYSLWSAKFASLFAGSNASFEFGNDRQEFGAGRERDVMLYTHMMEQMMRHYKESATDLLDARYDTAGNRWVHRLVCDEYRAIYGSNVYFKPLTLHVDYVELVRSARRLVKEI